MLRIAIGSSVAAVAIGLAVVLAAPGHCPAEEVDLLADSSLDGWTHFLVEADVAKGDVWSVTDGVLVCKGEPIGYLATKGRYTNFKLVVEWCWPESKEPGNSGVLMRITGKRKALPRCVEAQLKSGDAGDMYGFHGFSLSGDEARMKHIPNHELGGQLTGLVKIEGNEKEPGQWNKYEITAQGDTITLVVNGKEVNKATGCKVVNGRIGLQSEGGEIHFRTVKLTPLNE